MGEKPILFSAPMVRAILAGTKTQTRRVVKPQPPDWASEYWGAVGTYSGLSEPIHFWQGIHPEYDIEDKPFWPPADRSDEPQWDRFDGTGLRCPYGSQRNCLKPAARLWVRETWRVGAWLHRDPGGRLPDAIAADYQADNHARREWLPCPDREQFDRLVQQSIADAEKAGIKPYSPDTYNWDYGKGPTRWRPSIHMPRWASRITLEITGVRVERLQEISQADAIAEGIERRGPGWAWYDSRTDYTTDPRTSYRSLWESINGGGSWDANPWVWCVEFRRITP